MGITLQGQKPKIVLKMTVITAEEKKRLEQQKIENK